MKIKEIHITVKPFEVFKDYNTVDVIIETDGGRKEKHELVPTDDLLSKFDNMIEALKQELKYSFED